MVQVEVDGLPWLHAEGLKVRADGVEWSNADGSLNLVHKTEGHGHDSIGPFRIHTQVRFLRLQISNPAYITAMYRLGDCCALRHHPRFDQMTHQKIHL